MNTLRVLAFATLVSFCVPSGFAQTTGEHLQWAEQARTALGQQDYQQASAAAKKIASSSASVGLQLLAGDTLLRCGECKQAIEQFEKYLKDHPDDRPHLWQLGIALYFEQQYDEGAKLFEIHRKVNPNDVENAAWHFLCIAKKDSPAQAKKLLLPAPNDSRPPMEEVLNMLASGDTTAVKDRMNDFADNPPRAKSAKFYGNFYLGLYADALGDVPTARKYLDAAASDAPKNYMGDVAKVYARHLQQAD